MTLETSNSDEAFMQSFRAANAAPEETSTGEPSQEETVTTETAVADPIENAASPPADENAELERLRRIVATDPVRRQAYEQEVLAQYGYQTQAPPPPQPSAQQQQAQSPQYPVNPDEFDLTNMDHWMQVVGHVVEQKLNPAFQFIDEQKRDNEAYLQRQAMEHVVQNQKLLLDEIEKQVPGYSKAFQLYPGQGYQLAEGVTPEQEMLATYANTLFNRQIASFPQQLHGDPRVLKDVLTRIAPQLKKQAARLGISQGAQAAGMNPAIQRETYVETSNVAPTVSQNMFSKALEKHDDVGMMAAIRKRRA